MRLRRRQAAALQGLRRVHPGLCCSALGLMRMHFEFSFVIDDESMKAVEIYGTSKKR
jgi:hypothetical protein